MNIHTPRLLLRPFTEADAADLYEYARDPRIGPFAGWAPHRSESESLEIIRTVFSAPGTFALERRDTGRVVGAAGFAGGHPAGAREACPDDEVGYSIAHACWGQGLAAEALEAVVGHGFTALGLHRLWCSHYAGNWRSRRVMEKCGFTYQFSRPTLAEGPGELRQTYFYVLTKESWHGRVPGAL